MKNEIFELNQADIDKGKNNLRDILVILDRLVLLGVISSECKNTLSYNIQQKKIKTEKDINYLMLTLDYYNKVCNLYTALQSYASINKENEDNEIINIYECQKELGELINKMKSEYNDEIECAKRVLLIDRTAVIIGLIAFFAIYISFLALAQDLFLVGFFAGAVPALLIPTFFKFYHVYIYQNELDCFSLVSNAEKHYDYTKKKYCNIFLKAENMRHEEVESTNTNRFDPR